MAIKYDAAKAKEIGEANASLAVDCLYSDQTDFVDPIASYAKNVHDSIVEAGIRGSDRDALKAYYAKVADLL